MLRYDSLSLFCCYSDRPALADSWYSLSYLYFCLLGSLVTVIVGLVVSAITGEDTSFSANPNSIVHVMSYVLTS